MLATVLDGNSTSIEECHPEQAVRVSVNDRQIKIQSRAIIHELFLFDSRGVLQLTDRANKTETTLSVGGLPSGIYFLRIKTDGEWISQKVIW